MANPNELNPDELAPEQPEETAPADDETFDVHDLIVALDPDIKGKFDPLSGLMMLNVSQAEYMESFTRFANKTQVEDDRDLINTINHETYHGLQASASGYYYDRQRRQFATLNAYEPVSEIPIPPDVQADLDTMRKEAGADPALIARADRAEAVVRAEYAIRYYDEVAMPGDNSVFGALHPAFFRLQDQLAKEEAQPNADGLSTLAILEGSAVAFAHRIMRPNGGAEEAMIADFANTPPVYRQLYDWTGKRAASLGQTGRAFELLLPTTALALCYTQPNNAYGPLLQLLAASEPGQAIAAGQAIIAKLPEIPNAGPILGTALDVRRRDPSYKLYDKFLDALATPRWSFDAYGLLADTANMDIIDTFPFSLITSDGLDRLPSAMDFNEFAARMYLMSLVMKKFSRRLEEARVRDLQAAWARDVLINMMEGK
jgi:hypothetical protein